MFLRQQLNQSMLRNNARPQLPVQPRLSRYSTTGNSQHPLIETSPSDTSQTASRNTTSDLSCSDSNRTQSRLEHNLIKVCNTVHKINGSDCQAMLHLVKRCIRDDIWPDTKFLTETCIEVQKMTDHPGFENSVIGKLLRRTRQTHLDVVKRVIFWQKYSREVQKELNQLKTNRTKSIKDELFKGKYLHRWILCFHINLFC